MANRSCIKSDKLQAVEIKFQQLQTREQEIKAEVAENAKVRCELDTLKLEHTREVYLLWKEIENLKDRKDHRPSLTEVILYRLLYPCLAQVESSI
jgi:hypothetical protein